MAPSSSILSIVLLYILHEIKVEITEMTFLHIGLYIDVMPARGTSRPLLRYGIREYEYGFMRASESFRTHARVSNSIARS